jgi:septum formation topological specificity factor MinE
MRWRSTHLDLNEQELKSEAVWLHTGGWNPPGSNPGGRIEPDSIPECTLKARDPLRKSRRCSANVVFISMGSSSGEDVPRGIDFLFSRNRLNVAVSRARRLAYLFASPRLLDMECRIVEQMRLVNALCRFVEVAEVSSSLADGHGGAP